MHPPSTKGQTLLCSHNTQHTRRAPIPFSFFVWAGVGDRELAEDTGLARSAYMSSESTLCTELLLDVALDTEETLLTLRDLDTYEPVCVRMSPNKRWAGAGGPGQGFVSTSPNFQFQGTYPHQTLNFRGNSR